MVFHLPNEQSLRLRINYTQQFTFTLLWNVGIAGMIVTGLFLIFFIFKQYQLRVAANQAMRESMLTQDQRATQNRISHRNENADEEGLIVELKPTPKTNLFKVINLLTSIWFYLFWVIASFVYLTFFMFGYFGRGNHVDVLTVFVLNGALILPTLLWKHKTKTVSWGKLKKEAIFTIIMLIIWMGVSIFLVVATKGACVCYYQDQYGFKVAHDAKLSTEFTRSGAIGVPCPENEVCRLYATVPQDATTGVFFNVHAGTKIESLTYELKLNTARIALKNVATPSFKLDNIETIGQRNVFSALFTNLQPNTLYQIVISDNNGRVLKSANYKTVPGYDAQQIKMAVGGDLGMTQQGKKMTSYLADFKPDVIILGGDTVYDDAMRSCFYSWDEFYAMFDTINTKLDRIVPLILTVGNHDVGFDALTDNHMRTSRDDYPLFFVYNPQHVSETNDVPTYENRKSYHYHIVGPTMHFNLDSGYASTYSVQSNFINDTILGLKKPYYYFANYHNPIYPACTNSNEGSNDRIVIEAGERLWTPLFDGYGFIASMEHHTHYRKFTYPIRNREVNMTKGTRYIGDGSWGVTQDPCTPDRQTPHLDFMEKVAFQEANHMWQVTVKLTDPATRTRSINYTAINLQGVVVIQALDQLDVLSS